MRVSVKPGKERTVVSLAGRFDFSSHREFRSACDEALQGGPGHAIELDFTQVEYMDSSALGMLLVLRDKAQAVAGSVHLANCHGAVKHVLDIACFDKLFSIA